MLSEILICIDDHPNINRCRLRILFSEQQLNVSYAVLCIHNLVLVHSTAFTHANTTSGNGYVDVYIVIYQWCCIAVEYGRITNVNEGE